MRGTMCRYITATHDEDGMRGFNMNDYNVRACVRSHLALHTLLTGDQFLSTISADACCSRERITLLPEI
jgi:hypothetical protein